MEDGLVSKGGALSPIDVPTVVLPLLTLSSSVVLPGRARKSAQSAIDRINSF